MIDTSAFLQDDEHVIFEDAKIINYRAQRSKERRNVAYGLAIAIPISAVLLYLLFLPYYYYESKYYHESIQPVDLGIFCVILVSVWSFFLLCTINGIMNLCSGFYKAFSDEELETYLSFILFTNHGLILKGLEQFCKKIPINQEGLITKTKDVIYVKREALASIEIEPRFYAFRINFRLKPAPSVKRGHIFYTITWKGEKIDINIPKFTEFGHAASPEIPIKHIDSPSREFFCYGFLLCYVIILVLLVVIKAI